MTFEFNSVTFLDRSHANGRGCFSLANLAKGTLLVSSVLVLPKEDVRDIVRYTYPWGRGVSSVCLSNATMVNSCRGTFYEQNLRIKSIDKERLTKTFEVIRDVIVGEELFLDYEFLSPDEGR